jgi:hypothetical protein
VVKKEYSRMRVFIEYTHRRGCTFFVWEEAKCMGELKSVVRAEREEESADEEEGRVLVVDL